MRRVILASFLCLAGCTEAAEPLPGWSTDFETAAEESRLSHRPLLIDFGASWCGPCKRMEAGTLRDKDVAYHVQTGFIAVKVDADKNPKLVEKYKVRGYPTLIIVAWDGKEIARRSGYVDAEPLLKWLMPHKKGGGTAAVKADPPEVASLDAAPRCEVVVKVVSNEYDRATREAEARLAERYLILAGRSADAGKAEEAAEYRRKANELKE